MPLKVTRLPDFTAGLVNKRVNPLNAPENSVSLGENIDLSQGGIKVRPGYTLAHNATNLTGTIRAACQAVFPTNEITYVAAQTTGTRAIVVESIAGGPASDRHTIIYDELNDRFLYYGQFTNGSGMEVWQFKNKTWTQLSTTGGPPPGRSFHAACYWNGYMVIHGGQADDGNTKLNDMWKLNCSTLVWSEITLSGSVPNGRLSHRMCLVGTNTAMILLGYGATGEYYDVDLTTGVCTSLTHAGGSPPDAQYLFSMSWDGDHTVYVVGGESAGGDWKNTKILNRTTRVWTSGANAPVTSYIKAHSSIYANGRLFTFGGVGGGAFCFVYTPGTNTWESLITSTNLSNYYRSQSAMNSAGNVLVHGGLPDLSGTYFVIDNLLDAPGTGGLMPGDGLYLCSTHLPSASMVFERVKTLTSSSGVCTFALLGDRLVITEGITDVPHVVLPGTLSTDPVGSWAQPMRVLVTYDGSTYHDVSDKVLDNDLDSIADIGGVTTRGAILICCDVPTVYGFYFEFGTVNTSSGATTEFSDDVILNEEADISREDIGNNIARWVKNGASTGHFEGPAKALAGAAVDLGGGLVKIPCTGHGFVETDTIEIRNTVAYNGTEVLPSQAAGDANNFVITQAYIAEVFAGDDEARKRHTLGTGKNSPLVEPGVRLDFGAGTIATIASISSDGELDNEVTLSADHVTADCDLYGVVVNDASVVTLSTVSDVPVTLASYTPNSKHAPRGAIRVVITADDLGANSAFVRIRLQAGIATSNSVGPLTITDISICERLTGSTPNGTPTPLTFNNGATSVDLYPRYVDWLTGTVYAVDKKVTQSGVVYKCLVAHTAGVFATDLAAGKWQATGDPLGYVDSDLISFTVDGTKDYLLYYTADVGTSVALLGSSAPTTALTTAIIGDSHVYYATNPITGSLTTYYGTPGVVKVEGLSGTLSPVTKLHVATTTDTSQLDTTDVDAFKQITVTDTTPGSALAYYALSVDQRQSFFIHNGTAIRTIAKLQSGTWRYINGADAWTDTGSSSPYAALRAAFAIAQNQMDATALAARDETDWAGIVGYPTLDFAVGIQADGNNLPTVTKFTVRVYDSGASGIEALIAGEWTDGMGWSDGTLSGGVVFGQNGSCVYAGSGGQTADYGVISGIPGYWFRKKLRGTAVGTSLTKVRYRAPCQPLQNIGSGRPDFPMMVFHDVSAGKILDYSIQMADESYTELSSAVVPLETDDFLYFGYLTPFTELELIMFEDNNDNISSLTAEYWTGTAWAELTIIDGTSADGKALRQRGKIVFAVPSSWKSNVPLEGLTFANDSNGRMQIMYWLRLSVSANISSTTAISEARVQPVPLPLVKYRHAAVFQNRVALANQASAPDQIAISQPYLEYGWTGPFAANYRLGGGAVTSLLSAWNTLLAGQVDRSVLISQVSGQDSDMTPIEAARHVPVNRQCIVSAPMSGTDDGSRAGLFFLNRYGAYCVTGLQADANFATARFQVLSDGVNWWESTEYPRIDLDYLHLACGEYWPARNWIVWSVPMIIDYAFDPGVAVVQSTTKVRIKHTGHTRTAGDVITITGMTNYSSTYTLHADTTTDWLVFTATYVAETTTRLARYSVSNAAQTTNNRLLVYDLSMGGWLPPFTIAAASLCTAYEYNANSPGKLGALRLLGGNYAGQIIDLFDPAATTDNGAAIGAFIDSQWMTHADQDYTPEWTKEFRKLYLYGITDNNFYIDIQKDGGTTSLSTLTETALTDPVLYSFVKAFQHTDGGNIKANLFKYRFSFTGPAHVQAVKLALGYERNELSTT